MLIRQPVLDGIRAGTITVAFRRWRRPTVRTGGTLMTAAGRLSILNVAVVRPADITSVDARQAGYPSREALLTDLETRPDGDLYKIEFGTLEADPRIALRASAPTESELEELAAKLAKMDARAPRGAWTGRALDLIAAQPAVLAAKLARQVGEETAPFKANIRKLKALGLTESLDVGYRISPRGAALRKHLSSR